MHAKLRAAAKLAGKHAPAASRELAGIAGVLMVAHGLDAIYPPAAWITGGLAVVGYVLATTKAAKA
jgi:hypothetical protein